MATYGFEDDGWFSKWEQPRPKMEGALLITKAALEKAQTYALLVAEHYAANIESGGFLLASPGEPGPDVVVTDVMLACDQSIDFGSVVISPRGVLASGREIERKKLRSIGWWHAHPGQTFHSGTDDANMRTVLHDIAIRNSWPTTGHDPGPRESSCYSLVVSASEKPPYAERAKGLACDACGVSSMTSGSVPIVEVEGYPEVAFDPFDMMEEIKSKTRRWVWQVSGGRPAGGKKTASWAWREWWEEFKMETYV